MTARRLERLGEVRFLQVPTTLGLEPLEHIGRHHVRRQHHRPPGARNELWAGSRQGCRSIHLKWDIPGGAHERSRRQLRGALSVGERLAMALALALSLDLAL